MSRPLNPGEGELLCTTPSPAERQGSDFYVLLPYALMRVLLNELATAGPALAERAGEAGSPLGERTVRIINYPPYTPQ